MKIWTLRACDIQSAFHWYWRLFDDSGAMVADHEVRLDPDAREWLGFVDLARYLRQAPDHHREQELRLLHEVGDFLGARVFGAVAARLAAAAPLVVRLQAEGGEAAEEIRRGIFFRPLEITRCEGRSLASRGVSLVVDVGTATTPKPRADRPLRVLAVFSLPPGAGALNLRQERYRLRQRLQFFANQGFALELKVLQFGATRAALVEILNEEDGWDVVHFSGHGEAAHLLLEHEDGSPDRIPGADFAELLRPVRHRLQWLTLSACSSAAATIAETRRWLGLETRDGGDAETAPPEALPALAQQLAEQLDCAVLAMRFPVADRFAIDLAERLYPQVFEKKQSLPRALATTVAALLEGEGGGRYPVLSQATPAIFGRQAIELELPLRKDPSFERPALPLGYGGLPGPPERLVGRVAELTRASRALAPQSEKRGVLFHGMSGAGKSSCARELAWLYEDLPRFSHLFYFEAPQLGSEIAGALSRFALEWERNVRELPMAHALGSDEDFARFLPQLCLFLQKNAVLVVLDNLESLLREQPAQDGTGEWREPRWAQLYAALHDHRGASRVVATSRLVPRLLPGREGRAAKVESIALHALKLDEALLLARELPNLGALLERGGAAAAQVKTLLEVVQGHPKLLELADKQAAEPRLFTRMLDAAGAATAEGRGRLDAFFEKGESSLGETDFQRELERWTRAIAESLPAEARLAFEVLCCIEDGDRQDWIVSQVWPWICKILGKEDPPAFEGALAQLQAAALLEAPRAKDGDEPIHWRIHAGVAEAARAQAGAGVQEAVDSVLAELWGALYQQGLQLEEEGQGGSRLVVHAGQHAAPYLLRRERWEEAATLLEDVVHRDWSPSTLAAVLPLLRRIAEATAGTEVGLKTLGVLATALLRAGQLAEAETLLRRSAQEAEVAGAFRSASASWGSLVNVLSGQGRFSEALEVVAKKKNATRRAGLGRWSELSDEAQRLQLLVSQGRAREVLDAVEALRPELATLRSSKTKEPDDSVQPWNVLEGLLDTGHSAALQLEDWAKCLELNSAVLEAKQQRGAPELELARTRFNDYFPLLELGRLSEAEELLEDCRETFEAAGHLAGVGSALTALADLASRLGHLVTAIEHERAALRYSYLVGDPEACAISHFNLANHFQRAEAEPVAALAHRLSAVLMNAATGSGNFARHFKGLVSHLKAFGDELPPLPTDFAALCAEVEKVPGVRFRELFERLPKDFAASGDEALAKVLAAALEAVRPAASTGSSPEVE